MNAATKFVQERKHCTKNAKSHHFEESYHPNDAKLKDGYLNLASASSM